MASITTAGIEPTDLPDYVGQVEELLKTIFGADLNTDQDTPQGQIAGIVGLFFAAQDEIAVHTANGLNLFTAAGLQLDDMGTLFANLRIAGELSSVTCTLSGTSGTIVPAGARARTPEGAVFASDAQAIISTTGTVDVLFRSRDDGPIVAGIDELTEIIDVISGWTGITNTAAAVLGRDAETDFQYRSRYRGEVAVNARGSLEAIRARVLQVAAVTDCKVEQNDTGASITVHGLAIAAGSVLVIVEGGADADIADAIAQTKGTGVPTVGNETADYQQVSGSVITIRFRRVTHIPVAIEVSLTALAGFPSDGLATIRQNLLQWFSGEWPVPGPGIFDQSGVGIGEEIDINRIRTPVNAVPSHQINTLTVTRTGGAAIGTPNLDERYMLASDDIVLNLTV